MLFDSIDLFLSVFVTELLTLLALLYLSLFVLASFCIALLSWSFLCFAVLCFAVRYASREAISRPQLLQHEVDRSRRFFMIFLAKLTCECKVHWCAARSLPGKFWVS